MSPPNRQQQQPDDAEDENELVMTSARSEKNLNLNGSLILNGIVNELLTESSEESDDKEDDDDDDDDQEEDEDAAFYDANEAAAASDRQDIFGRDESASVLINNEECRKRCRNGNATTVECVRFMDDYDLIVNQKINIQVGAVRRPFTSVESKFKLFSLN